MILTTLDMHVTFRAHVDKWGVAHLSSRQTQRIWYEYCACGKTQKTLPRDGCPTGCISCQCPTTAKDRDGRLIDLRYNKM